MPAVATVFALAAKIFFARQMNAVRPAEHHQEERRMADESHEVSDLEALLLAIDWEDLTERLLAYGLKRASRYHGTAYVRQKVKDYVQEAVKRMLDGTRHFESSEEALFGFLCGVIDSLMSHDAETMRRRGAHLSLVPSPASDDATDGIYEDRLASPEDLESDIILRNRLRAFISSLDDRELETYIVMRACDACTTTEEYAAAMIRTVEEVRNMDRRVRRRRQQW
jgi:hypothetical protein